MNVRIHSSWEKTLSETFASTQFSELTTFVKSDYQQFNCYPPGSMIFEAFDRCPFDQVKVVLLGQDPYHGPDKHTDWRFLFQKGLRILHH